MSDGYRTSEQKFALELRKKPDDVRKKESDWVVAKFRNGTEWVPSLADIFRLVVGIADCEELKYPSRDAHGRPTGRKGGAMVFEFLQACGKTWLLGMADEDGFAEIQRAFKIPDRDRDGRLARANGAVVPEQIGPSTRRDPGLFYDDEHPGCH